MTMVAVCLFKEGGVLISDSRATKDNNGKYAFSDTLQKILYIRKNIALSYAGDVQIAGDVAREVRLKVIGDDNLKEPQTLAAKIPTIATLSYLKYVFIRGRPCAVYLLLAGVDSSGKTYAWVFKSPGFKPIKIENGFDVIGSGEVVAPYLEKSYKNIDSSHNDLKSKADALIVGLESELQKHDVNTVGGLFQVVLLTPEGIRPLRYGFMDLDPLKSGDAKSMELIKGKWTQTNEATREKVELLEPSKLVTNVFKETQFHEYAPPNQDKKIPKWYSYYFITCSKVKRDITTTEFQGVLTQIASLRYPATIPIIASMGFWGTAGENQIELRVEKDGKQETIYSKKIHTEYLPEIVELDAEIKLVISSPGPAFLEFLINKQVLARKALYFGNLNGIPKSDGDKEKFLRERQSQLTEEHRQLSDAFLNDKNSVTEYFVLCENCIHEGNVIKFINEMKAVYWKSYPLPLRVYIASAIRMPKGKHSIRIELVNAATRYNSNITNTTVENTSDCLVTPIHGEMVVNIPEPGIYFFNLYVDDKFITSALLPAELSKAKYSYSLTDEGEKMVESGELIILPRRSILESEIKNNK